MKFIHHISGRGLIVYANDIIMSGLAFAIAIYLRLGDDTLLYAMEPMVQAGVSFMVISAVVFFFSGLYRGVWRYASMNDLMAITRAVSVAILVFLLIMFLWSRFLHIPRSVIPITWFVLMALLGGPRFFYRLIKDRRFDLVSENGGNNRIAVLLAGAGDGAELFIRTLKRTPNASYQAVGIVSESPGRVGRQIHGVEVIGSIDDIAGAVKKLRAVGIKPQRLVLTRDDLNGAQIRSLLDQADEMGMTLARIPKVTDFKSGVADKADVKPVAVEDLLGRPQTALDRDAMAALIGGKRVLVTGAGGSIGSELVRQVSALKPAEIMLLDNSELALYTIDREVMEQWPDVARVSVIADVRHADRIGRIFARFSPDLVFHAAALKHVPMVEANIVEGTTTNVNGTVTIADTCVQCGVKTMVLISTDKAVNPTSIMGATKRIGESYCQALDLQRAEGEGTRFVTVRFGNVLGSTGSVVPLFQRQLANGGPLTVTHKDMTRYFMTVGEAVELVLQASALGTPQGSDGNGKIFVLDMGEPIRIMDLAEQMIRLAGLKPGKDIKIDIVGTRPGEKLFEEIFHGAEPPVATESPGLLLAAPRAGNLDDLRPALKELAEACRNDDLEAIFAVIQRLVPEYHMEPASDAKTAAGSLKKEATAR
ncbi:MAG: nucleoside-diphosphate sugar epimerase/dehydratase [Proteobacteria bacterium]|nr:nucleoside-diphosphate sugar epimerase/dehydratase [Pseudomonadota bacterium]